MADLNQYVPITVISAIILFFIKEVLESYRRNKAENSKNKALAHVIGEELKENFRALDNFYKIIDFLNKHQDCKDLKLKFICLRHGYESCVIEADQDSLEMTIPIFKTNWYEDLLMDLAEKDEKLTETVSKAYEVIYFIIEKRNLLASLMAGELTSFLRMCAVTTVNLLPESREYYEAELSVAYKAVTGKENIFP